MKTEDKECCQQLALGFPFKYVLSALYVTGIVLCALCALSYLILTTA